MTVKELREALARLPDESEVVCQGTSVAGNAYRALTVGALRAEGDDEHDLWPFQGYPFDAVVILTRWG